LPEPYGGFDPAKALPRPYRPFRWAYHQTMCTFLNIAKPLNDSPAPTNYFTAFNKLEPDWWLEVENTYKDKIAERVSLFQKHGSAVLDALPGSELACKELMEICLQFYCARYPSLFTLTGSGSNTIFTNNLLRSTTNIKSMHPLHVILYNIPEDFAIVLRNETNGNYYFRAGVICSSLGWNVGTKIGLSLEEIHVPIPDYKEKMSFSMDRYFSKMPTNNPIQRGSWGLEIGTPLYMPPGDPHEKLRGFQDEKLEVENCYLRVDWQTLRRLPLSAGIVFNFTALFTGVGEMRDEKYVPELLAKVLREGKKSLMEYKGTWHVEHVCMPALERWAEEQRTEKVVEEGWEVGTLEESPWFPGWEEKWHRQQGF